MIFIIDTLTVRVRLNFDSSHQRLESLTLEVAAKTDIETLVAGRL